MTIEEWLNKGLESKELTHEEYSRWYATKDRDTATAVRNDLIIQYRQSQSDYYRKIIEHYESLGIKRAQSEFCTEREWNYSPTGELYEVLMLIGERIRTEQWWREQITRDLTASLDSDGVSNYIKTGIEHAIRVVMAPITTKESK
jgi:hypothetical protein